MNRKCSSQELRPPEKPTARTHARTHKQRVLKPNTAWKCCRLWGLFRRWKKTHSHHLSLREPKAATINLFLPNNVTWCAPVAHTVVYSGKQKGSWYKKIRFIWIQKYRTRLQRLFITLTFSVSVTLLVSVHTCQVCTIYKGIPLSWVFFLPCTLWKNTAVH